MSLTDAQRLKFRLFEHGLSVSEAAARALHEAVGGRPISSADFASTSGIILRLENDVWVNAPITTYNPNFVDNSPFLLDHDGDGLVIRGEGLASRAQYWPQPRYHGEFGITGRPLNDFVVTHGDRVRLSPLQGCSIVCKFCDVPYGSRYALKPIEGMVDGLRRALTDPRQPARHVLISGGTPRPQDVPWLRDVYTSVLSTFSSTDIDIMMVPVPGLLDIDELHKLGVCEFSINIELFSDDVARMLMPKKHRQGRDVYLDFIERAALIMGAGRARSMLMVGLEPVEQTLLGVEAIIDRGGTPVLSPFRPDPSTPLASLPPPSAEVLEETFLRASEIADARGVKLGPTCVPCSHNTLTLPQPGDSTASGESLVPTLV